MAGYGVVQDGEVIISGIGPDPKPKDARHADPVKLA